MSTQPTASNRDENPSFVPLRHAVIITSAKPGTIRQWARDERVATKTSDDAEPLYAVTDLVRCEREDRETRVRHAYGKLAQSLRRGA